MVKQKIVPKHETKAIIKQAKNQTVLVMTTPTRSSVNYSTMRREQAGVDPLGDSSLNSSRNVSPVPDPNNAALQQMYPPPPLPPQFAARPVSAAEAIDSQVDVFLKNCRSTALQLADVPVSYDGLLALRRSLAWQDVLKLCETLLRDPDFLDPNTHLALSPAQRQHILQIRLEAFFRLKMFDDLTTSLIQQISTLESDPASHTPHMLTSHRLQLHEVQLMTGYGHRAMEAILCTQSQLRAQEQARGGWAVFWLWQSKAQAVNAYVRLRSWTFALQELRKMQSDLDSAESTVAAGSDEALELRAARVWLGCRVVQLLLQMGALTQAQREFDAASQHLLAEPRLSTDGEMQRLLLLCQGLLQFAEEKFEIAAETFSTLIDVARGALAEGASSSSGANAYAVSDAELSRGRAIHLSLRQESHYGSSSGSSNSDHTVLAAAVNNFAIISLYLKQNVLAIERLERLVGEDPLLFMTDAVVFNLCTMYDLCFAPDSSAQKKKVLQKVATRFGLVDPVLHWRSFRAT